MAAINVSAKAKKILRANPLVTGFSETLKPKITAGKTKRVMAIRVYVAKKLPAGKIPPKQQIPPMIDGVPTDVVAIGEIEPSAPANRKKFRPMLGGISCLNNTKTGAGTLGYFVRDKKKPAPPEKPQWYILSCAHVLDNGSKGKETRQQSPGDGGKTPKDIVGSETAFSYNGVDAAIAKIDVGAKAEIFKLAVPSGATAKAKKGMVVAKSGRTTGVTDGTVIDQGAELNFRKWATASGAVRFTGVILVNNPNTHFGEPGDSGSLVIDPKTKAAVGLLFAGPKDQQTPLDEYNVFVAPIDAVLKQFPDKMLVLPGETYP